MTFGQRLKKLRTAANITQKDMADKLNVTFQTVSKWENDSNEPDISTIKKISELLNCTIEDLFNDNDDVEEPKEETKQEAEQEILPDSETTQIAKEPVEVVTKTIVVHQKEMHVCEKCHRDIPENELEMEQVRVQYGYRGRPSTYRTAYYHKKCLQEKRIEEAKIKVRQKRERASSEKKKCFGWGIAAGVVALGIAIAIFLYNTEYVHPALGVLYSVLIGYAIFAMIYCIISGSYIGEVFVWCASLSIKFPGLIFSWDIDGFIWVITMKIIFAIIGFLVGVCALLFAIVFSATLGAISFPFVLIHNERTDYEDAL